jgi:hypothetical protein
VNTTELWLFKCRNLGERENLGNIEAFLVEEMQNNEDIDWKLAYIQLNEFAQELKEKYLERYKKYLACELSPISVFFCNVLFRFDD